mgnify:CR=1 FL=1
MCDGGDGGGGGGGDPSAGGDMGDPEGTGQGTGGPEGGDGVSGGSGGDVQGGPGSDTLSETESAGMPGTAEEAMGETSDSTASPQDVQIALENTTTPYGTTTDSNTAQAAVNTALAQTAATPNMSVEEANQADAAAVAVMGQDISMGGIGSMSPGGTAANHGENPATVAQVTAINQPSTSPNIGYAINNPQPTVASVRASQAFAQVNPTLTNVMFGIAGMMPGPMGMMASLAGAHAGHGMMSLAEQMGVPGMGAISDVMTDIEESIMGTEANPSGIANAIGDIGAAIGGIGGTASIGESNADIGGPDEATLAGMSAVTPASQSFAQAAPSTAAIGSTIGSFLDTSATTPLISIPGLSTAVLGVDEDLGATTPLSVLSPTGRGSSFRRSRTTSARDRAFGSANLFRPTLSSGISL